MANRPIMAAGAVVWRPGSDGDLEICVVHRPHRNDWSLPKGKQDDGEHILATALREIAEETGHHVTLGRPLRALHYEVKGRPKVVHYWSAEADEQPDEREPNEEVDEVVFLSAPEALTQLTYPHDQQLVQSVVTQPVRTQPLIVLRHAHSLARADWTGDDDDRGLNDRGRAQAEALVGALNAFGVTRAVSSQAARCVDTLRPWAEQELASIKLSPRLSETGFTGSDDIADVVRDLRGQAAVICTHRPVLPSVFAALGVQPDPAVAKGEFVVAHLDAQDVVATERHLL